MARASIRAGGRAQVGMASLLALLASTAGCRDVVELEPGASSSCTPIGEVCGAAAECCSHACAGDGSGARVCQALGGCFGPGERCRHGNECCGGTCADVDATTHLGVCAEATACAAAGDVCSVAGDPAATRECCSPGLGMPMPCRATGVGVDRCGRGGMPMCADPGAACTTPEDCCSGVCVDDGGGALACQAGCRAGGETCTRSADCCTGTCMAGYCVGTRTCGPLGTTCTDAASCCSGTCGAGTCVAPPV